MVLRTLHFSTRKNKKGEYRKREQLPKWGGGGGGGEEGYRCANREK